MKVPNLTFVFDRKKQADNKKTGVVELRIGSGKGRKYISTGIFLNKREWLNGTIVNREDWHELNQQLQIIKKKAGEIIIKMMEENRLEIGAIPALLKDEICMKQSFLEYAKEVAERRYESIAAGTKAHYKNFFTFMEEWKNIVYFSDLTERNILKMDDELRNRGLQKQSRWNYHRKLKMFIAQALDEGLVKRNPYARVGIKRGSEGGIKRYLTPAEFHALENCLINVDCIRKVRDLFVFQTYTMLSYTDLAAFDYGKCKKVDGYTVYKGRRQKTGQEFIIVLLEPAMKILKRYKYKLPIISNTKYNAYLKTAVTYAQIDKLITTHWARHTGATLMLNEGKVPMHIVQHLLGHASIRETEKTYAKVLDETIVKTMASFDKRKRA